MAPCLRSTDDFTDPGLHSKLLLNIVQRGKGVNRFRNTVDGQPTKYSLYYIHTYVYTYICITLYMHITNHEHNPVVIIYALFSRNSPLVKNKVLLSKGLIDL